MSKVGYAQMNSGHIVSGVSVKIENTTAVEVIAAPVSNASLYITHILVTNADATVGTWVNITDGDGGDVLFSGYAAENGGGFTFALPTPVKLTKETALYAVCVTTSAEVKVCASGFKA